MTEHDSHSTGQSDTCAVPSVDELRDDDRVALADARHSGWFQWETQELYRGFSIESHHQVLDIGSGDGGYAGFCARLSRSVCCIDIDADRLRNTLQYAREAAIGDVDAIVAPADRLPIADASKDRIICTEVLEHVGDPTAALREAWRVGREDALYLFTVPDARSETFQKHIAQPAYFEAPNHIHIYDQEQFRSLVQQAGFDVLEHTSFGFYQSMWLSLYWLCDSNDIRDRSHPLLRSWDRTWALFMDTPQAATARAALDDIMPRTQLILARKVRATA